jgi:tRNA dimethylallyltransferase
MSIGTAVPSPQELATVKHHFIHHKSINDNYNVGSFEKDALQILNTLFKTHNIAILVGGSGLYINAITKGLDHFPAVDSNIRISLNTQLKTQGIKHLQEQLQEIDSVSYNTIAIDNPHRLIRALEISIGTGKPYSSFLNKPKQNRPFKTITVGINAERDVIYNRINQRVDIMIEQGLLNEVQKLLPFKNLNPLNTVGYKELFNYLDGNYDLDFSISEIKKNTRRFAKRQLTWFRKNQDTLWVDYNQPIETVITKIESQLQ